MKKAIISVLMTLLFLVNMTQSVAMSRNNQLNPRSSGGNDDGTNKSVPAETPLPQENILTKVPLNKSEEVTAEANTNDTTTGHQIKTELEQIHHQAKSLLDDIKIRLESLGCRIGISRFCPLVEVSVPMNQPPPPPTPVKPTTTPAAPAQNSAIRESTQETKNPSSGEKDLALKNDTQPKMPASDSKPPVGLVKNNGNTPAGSESPRAVTLDVAVDQKDKSSIIGNKLPAAPTVTSDVTLNVNQNKTAFVTGNQLPPTPGVPLR